MMKNKKVLFGIGAVVLMTLIAATPAVYGDHFVPGSGTPGRQIGPSLPPQGGHQSAPDPEEPGLTEQMMGIFETYEVFLTQMNSELQTYVDQHGDLTGYVFDSGDLTQLNNIYVQLEALIDENHQDPPGDWQGYLGWAPPQHLLEPDRWIYMFWIPHWLIPAFCVVVDGTNLLCALWLGAMIGTGTFDATAMKILYGISIFLRDRYTGYTVSRTDQRWNQDPSDDDGVKLTFVNLVMLFPFLPDDVDIDPQTFGDIPPRTHGSYVFPNPV